MVEQASRKTIRFDQIAQACFDRIKRRTRMWCGSFLPTVFRTQDQYALPHSGTDFEKRYEPVPSVGLRAGCSGRGRAGTTGAAGKDNRLQPTQPEVLDQGYHRVWFFRLGSVNGAGSVAVAAIVPAVAIRLAFIPEWAAKLPWEWAAARWRSFDGNQLQSPVNRIIMERDSRKIAIQVSGM